MSDYIERLMGRANNGDFWGDLPPETPPIPRGTEDRAVRRDSFDKSAWDQITDQVPALGEQVAEAQEKHPTAAAGYEDLFNLLNQGDPRFHEAAAMKPEYVVQRAMEQSMFAAEDFQWVRNETKYDEYNTALAMLAMQDQMDQAFEQVDEVIEAIKQAQEELAEAMAAAQEFLAGLPGSPGEGESVPGVVVGGDAGADDPTTEQEIIERLENALKGMAELEQQGEQAAAEAGAQLQAGASEAREAIEADKDQAAAYGIAPGVLQKMDYDERRRLAERLNRNRIARFSKLLGAMRMEADAERRRKVTGVPSELYDITLGRDVHKALASEITNLAMPELEDVFWIRFAEKRLLQWETRGTENMGRGPIIFVCDESGSMGAQVDAEGNTREAWSKAVALSLVDQAKRDNRDFIYIGFSGTGQQWESHFIGGHYDWQKVVEFAEHFWGGGTAYEGPLTRAMELIGIYEKARKPKPDVVFVTDDECRVGDNFVETWRDVKERADVRCYGIRIGASGRRESVMDKLTDRTITINQLTATPQAVVEMFRTI